MKVEQQNSQQKAGLHIALTEKKQINRNCKLSELDQFFLNISTESHAK